MNKLFTLLSIVILIAACTKKEERKFEQQTEVSKTAVESLLPSLNVTSNITVLRNDNNSNALFFIDGVMQDNHTASIILPEEYNKNDFVITSGFPMKSAFGVSIKPLKKDTAVYVFTLEAKDKNNNTIFHQDNFFFALKKLYPAKFDESNTPMLDDESLVFNAENKDQYVLLNQISDENNTVIVDGTYDNKAVQGIFPITQYGFNNKLFKGSTKENQNKDFVVDNSSKEFKIGESSFSNCLIPATFQGTFPCALKISHVGKTKADAVFYLRLNENYVDTSINLHAE